MYYILWTMNASHRSFTTKFLFKEFLHHGGTIRSFADKHFIFKSHVYALGFQWSFAD